MYKKFLLLAAVVLVTGLGACKKDKQEMVVSAASMSVKVDGVTKRNISPVYAVLYASENTIQIAGQLSTYEGVTLIVQKISVGEYDLSADTNTGVYLADSRVGYGAGYLSTKGTLKITSITDKEVAGSFSFAAESMASDLKTKNITEGKFRAQVQKL